MRVILPRDPFDFDSVETMKEGEHVTDISIHSAVFCLVIIVEVADDQLGITEYMHRIIP